MAGVPCAPGVIAYQHHSVSKKKAREKANNKNGNMKRAAFYLPFYFLFISNF